MSCNSVVLEISEFYIFLIRDKCNFIAYYYSKYFKLAKVSVFL